MAKKVSVNLDHDTLMVLEREMHLMKETNRSKAICRLIQEGSQYEVIRTTTVQLKYPREQLRVVKKR